MEMTRIDVDSGWLLGLLDEMNRHRSLNDREVAVLERIINRKTSARYRWTHDADRELKSMAKRRGGIRAFAQQRGISAHAAHMRLCRIRNLTSGNVK